MYRQQPQTFHESKRCQVQAIEKRFQPYQLIQSALLVSLAIPYRQRCPTQHLQLKRTKYRQHHLAQKQYTLIAKLKMDIEK